MKKTNSYRPQLECFEDRLVPAAIVAEYSDGLYRHNEQGWFKLTSYRPEDYEATRYGDQVFADFGNSGIYRYQLGSGWQQITGSGWNAENMGAARDTLWADFGSKGLFRWKSGNWAHISNWNPEDFEVADNGSAIVDFGSNGIWHYQSTGWVKLSDWNPEGMKVAFDRLVVDFGNNGLWSWLDPMAHGAQGGWKYLSHWNAEEIGVSDGGEVYADFGNHGLWRWQNFNWVQITTLNAQDIEVTDDGALYTFFVGHQGLHKFALNQGWQNVHSSNPMEIVEAGF